MNIVLLETAYGKLYVPDTDEGQYAWLSVTGRYHEHRFIEEVCALLDERPAGTAIDAGANFGVWTLALAQHARRVVAYEVQPDVCLTLYETICENALGEKVSVRNQALWSGDDAVLEVPRIDMGPTGTFRFFGGISVKISRGMPGSDADTHRVLAVTLDGEIRDKVSFIKIDVEGSEHEVLRGARQIIEKDKPIMFVEVIHPNTDTDGLVQQIKDLGYGVIRRGNTPENVLAIPI